MSTKSLDVFALRDSVVGEYKKFATSFTTIHAEDIRQQVEDIYAANRYWPEPLIQVNPNYKRTTTIDSLVASGVLEPGCGDIFRTSASGNSPGASLSLYKHQEQAIALASQGESLVVTTGTGTVVWVQQESGSYGTVNSGSTGPGLLIGGVVGMLAGGVLLYVSTDTSVSAGMTSRGPMVGGRF
jgi:hypothetical protein